MSEQHTALRLADALMEPVVLDKHAMQAAAELRRLHAEVERLKTVPMKYRRMEFNAQLQAEVEEQCRLNGMGSEREARLRTEVQQLTTYMDALNARAVADAEEIGKLRADAERYRWLRDNPWPSELQPVISLHQNARWDDAIDAAKERT